MSDVSVLVVTYNSAELISECLAAAVDLGVREILVWDNASTDATRARLAECEDRFGIQVFAGPANVGFGAAVNRVAEHASGSALLLLNPDCRVDRGAVETMVAEMRASASTAACAPMMRYPDGRFGISGGGEPTVVKELLSDARIFRRLGPNARRLVARAGPFLLGRRSAQMIRSTQPGEPIDVEWLSGFCLLVSAAAWGEVGGFDERYFMYYEDVDLGRRLRERGYRLQLVRTASALHHESQSSTPATKSRLYRESRRTYFSSGSSRATRGLAGFLAWVRLW